MVRAMGGKDKGLVAQRGIDSDSDSEDRLERQTESWSSSSTGQSHGECLKLHLPIISSRAHHPFSRYPMYGKLGKLTFDVDSLIIKLGFNAKENKLIVLEWPFLG